VGRPPAEGNLAVDIGPPVCPDRPMTQMHIGPRRELPVQAISPSHHETPLSVRVREYVLRSFHHGSFRFVSCFRLVKWRLLVLRCDNRKIGGVDNVG
jgi:hypothetical protein